MRVRLESGYICDVKFFDPPSRHARITNASRLRLQTAEFFC